MSLYTPHYVQNGPVRLAVYTDGPQANLGSVTPILFIHGWPEAALSWHPQMQALAQAGYPVLAMDVRGFGLSDAPHDVALYRIDHIIRDIEAVLDHFGLDEVTLCGHDWGGIIVWHAARALEHRVQSVISISTPYVRRAPIDPIAIFKKRFGEEHYFVHFNERPGEADALFNAHSKELFQLMFRRVPKGAKLQARHTYIPARLAAYIDAGSPPLSDQILSSEQLDALVKTYARSGFHGGLNLYRNTTANWELTKDWSDTITQPTLMLSPAQDVFLPPSMADAMTPERVPKLKRVTLENCGHWAMWEQPDAVNAAILEWLG